MRFWPFDKQLTQPPVAGSVNVQELRTIAARLDELARRVESCEKKVDTLDVDWSEWYDKFRRLYARIAKRQERDEDQEKTSQQDAPIDEPDISQHHPARAARVTRRNY